MRLPGIYLATLAGLLLVACSTSAFDRQAADYSSRSPRTEAELDFKKGDFRIYSAMGFSRYYPGLDPDKGRRIATKHGERMLEGTTDAIESRSQSDYIRAATGYAAEYNRRKASLIERQTRPNKREAAQGGERLRFTAARYGCTSTQMILNCTVAFDASA